MARMTSRWLLPIALALAFLAPLAPSPARGQEATPAGGALPDGVTIVANGLSNPRNFTWSDDGTFYLALAGVGGPSMGDIGGSPSGFTGGPTASVVTLADGCTTTVADELPSSIWEGVGWVWGTADVAWLDGQLYSLESGGGSDFGNFDTPSGVYRIADNGAETLVASFSAWSREHPPAFVAPDYNADGSLVDMIVSDDRLWVLDAVGGRIITVTPDGEIALFKDWSPDHPVPTGMVPDGAGGLYVANLTAIPYPNGGAKVVQMHADGTVEDVWTGLTAVTHLGMGPDGALYASELATNTIEEEPFLPPDSGRIVRQTGPDTLEPIVTDLPYPVSLEFGPDSALYVTAPAFGAGTGEGQGALLRVDPSAPLPISFAGVDLSTPSCGDAAKTSAAPSSGNETGQESKAVAAIDLLRLPLSGETIEPAETFGLTRLTFDAGGSERVIAGSGMSALFVETGMLSVTPVASSPPLAFIRAGAEAGSASELRTAGALVLEAGNTLVLPAGSAAEIRNQGDDEATALAVLSAPDAAAESGEGVARAELAPSQEVPAAPGILTLQRVTISAGERLEFAGAPVQTVAAGVDPRQAMLLSGRMKDAALNRSTVPIDVYVISIAPAP